MVFAPYPAKTGAPCVEPRATGDSAPAQSGLSLKWGEPTHGCTTNRMGGFFETNFWLTLFTLRKIHNFSINGGFFHVKNLNSTGIQWVDQICWIWGRPIVRAPHQALHLLTRDRNFGQFRWVSHIFPTKKGLDFTNMTNKYKWDVDSAIGPLMKFPVCTKIWWNPKSSTLDIMVWVLEVCNVCNPFGLNYQVCISQCRVNPRNLIMVFGYSAI